MAITFVLIGASLAFAQQNGGGEDLLNPALDQPLAQYESTQAAPFEPIVESVPELPLSVPTTTTTPRQPVELSLPIPDSGNGQNVQLAPNPLAEPGSVPLSSPNDFKVRPKASSSTTNPAWSNSVKTLNSDPLPIPTPTQRPATPPKKKPTGKKVEPKKKKQSYSPRKPVITYDVYRDPSPWPVDPRKPINPCTQQGGCKCGSCSNTKPGLHGRPHQPHEPGGCNCGKRCPNKHPQFSLSWPRPFSAKLDERNPERAAARYAGCHQPKINDRFDRFANFRLIDYQRTDNGYCGPESDPYGCLGESKSTGVAGVGFRIQSEPVAPLSPYPLR